MSERIIPRSLYLTIWAILLAFTFLTWWIATFDLGRWNVVIGLAIAFTKATLVVLYFMHVRYSSRRTKLLVSAGLVWLGILLVLTMSDYLTRYWLPP